MPDETTPRNLFMFLSFVMTFISGIGAAGAIYWFVNGVDFDRIIGIMYILLFIGYAAGLVGIFKPQPPLHYGILISSLINLGMSIVIVFFAHNSTGLLQGSISFLLLYLGLRFPLQFANGRITLDTERLLS